MTWLPPWRRAPLRAWRSPSLFLGVAVAAFVLGVAGGSRPMFASSAARASLGRDVETGCRFDVGFRAERQVWLGEGAVGLPGLAEATEALDSAVGRIAGIDPAVVTVIGDRAAVGVGDEAVDVQLLERTGFRDHIDVLGSRPLDGAGVWLPDTVAERLGVVAGDRVGVALSGASVRLPVAGVYRDLRYGRDRSWCSMRWFFEPRTAAGSAPPPVVLFDDTVLRESLAGAATAQGTRVWWEYPPDAASWDLPTAERATGELQRVADGVNNRSSDLGGLLGYGTSNVDVPRSVHKAQRTAASVESVAGPVALGTIGVAVVMLLAAARSWLARRSQEVTVLALRGAGPTALALKAMAELLPALVLGAVVGLGAAVVVVRAIGPDPRIERGALVEGVVVVGVALLVSLGALAAVVSTGVRRVGVAVGGAAPRVSLPLWEPAVLAMAAAAVYELQTRETVVDDTRVDGLLLLFPLLLLAGGAGLAARLVLSARALDRLARRLPTPAWLAVRRLASARLRASLIVTGAAISSGIVVFAGAMSSSVSATVYAKATLGHGSAQIVRLSHTQASPDSAPLPGVSTLVTRTAESGVVRRGHEQADVLGVDPDTFADAAFWDESFANQPLPDLLARLEPGTDGAAVPAIGVGAGLPERFVLSLRGKDGATELEVAIVARSEAFPGLGLTRDRPLVVVDRQALTRKGVVEHAEVWVDDASPGVAERLAKQGVQIVFSARPAADIQGTLLQPQVWAIDYLEAVGLAAGLVTVAGLGLYFAAHAERRQLGAAVARRLGLPTVQAAAATALEVLSILVGGLLFGVGLSWLAVRLVFRKVDPLPHTAPDALLRFDLSVVVACAMAALVTAVFVTWVVEWRTARASLPELLRDAG
jgi:putative ABC transport system permease protein